MLYPDDRTYEGKELRLKQQHFFVSATIQVRGVGKGPLSGAQGGHSCRARAHAQLHARPPPHTRLSCPRSSHSAPRGQDVVRRYREGHPDSWEEFPDKVAFQLNDTHPTVAVPELMRVLMDDCKLGWTKAWDICTKARSRGR